MGVTGLWQVIDKKYVASSCKLSDLDGQRLAVDASIWTYQFSKGMAGKKNAAVIVAFLKRLCLLLLHKIKVIFVFDGGNICTLKKRTLKERSERRAEANLLLEKSRKRKLLENYLFDTLAKSDLEQNSMDSSFLINTSSSHNHTNPDESNFSSDFGDYSTSESEEYFSDNSMSGNEMKMPVQFNIQHPYVFASEHSELDNVKFSIEQINTFMQSRTLSKHSNATRSGKLARNFKKKFKFVRNVNQAGFALKYETESDDELIEVPISCDKKKEFSFENIFDDSDKNTSGNEFVKDTQNETDSLTIINEPDLFNERNLVSTSCQEMNFQDDSKSTQDLFPHKTNIGIEKNEEIFENNQRFEKNDIGGILHESVSLLKETLVDFDTDLTNHPENRILNNNIEAPLDSLVDLTTNVTASLFSDELKPNTPDTLPSAANYDLFSVKNINSTTLLKQASAPSLELKNEFISLLDILGIPWIVAEGDAEVACVSLEMSQLVDGIITDDNDAFLFGGRTIIRHLFRSTKEPQIYAADKIPFTRNQLIFFAYLLGSDYSVRVKGIGKVKAVEIVEKCSNFDDFLTCKMKYSKYEFPSDFASQELFNFYLTAAQKEQIEGDLNMQTVDIVRLVRFMRENCDWTAERCLNFIKPLIS